LEISPKVTKTSFSGMLVDNNAIITDYPLEGLLDKHSNVYQTMTMVHINVCAKVFLFQVKHAIVSIVF